MDTGVDAGAAIGAFLCFFGVGLPIAVLVGAIILRAAISLFNKMAGGVFSPGAVPEPSILKAMGITLVTTVVNLAASFVVGLVIGGAAVAGGARGAGVNATAQIVSLPVSVLVMAGMLSLLLPTTFGRAFLVTLCHFAIVIAIMFTVGLVFAVLSALVLR